MYELGRKMLEEAGYSEIGMDHFALHKDSLWQAAQGHQLHRNFMGYTPHQVSPLIGLGVSSIGDSWSVLVQNEKLLENYQKRVDKNELPLFRGHLLSSEDQVLRRHILNLMTQFETEWSSSEAQTEFLSTVPERLIELEKDGLIEVKKNSCRVTDLGRPFLRNICMAFDARLIRKTPSTQLFSQTI